MFAIVEWTSVNKTKSIKNIIKLQNKVTKNVIVFLYTYIL